MKQIIIINGGSTYRSYKEYFSALKQKELSLSRLLQNGWKDTLEEKLGKGFQAVMPKMPNNFNAKYPEWKIWFEKMIPFLEKEVVLIGHSLGGIFLAKYLSENKFSRKILGTFLIAAPYGENSFALKKDLNGLQEQSGKLIFFQSVDDKIVPFSDFLKYKKALPDAEYREFKDKGHFNQKTFPEIVREIKKIF
jgi:uncharacterized protein